MSHPDYTPQDHEDNELRLVAAEIIRKLTVETANRSQLELLEIQIVGSIASLDLMEGAE